ncbi:MULTISPECIES: hypothetical protein [Aerosakkonema]
MVIAKTGLAIASRRSIVSQAVRSLNYTISRAINPAAPATKSKFT